jgi:beta-lactamase class D
MRLAYAILIAALYLFSPATSHAADGCTIVVDYDTTEVLYQDGDCTTRRSAQSTFKLPLAVMGFDSGILKDAHNPVWPYDPAYVTNREEERHEADPTRWEKDSVVWYSQRLTKKLGFHKFKSYVGKFNYGNKDISGDPGKNNGLTNSWLSSSLQISPIEQVAFIRAFLSRNLDVSDSAYKHTKSIIPRFFTKGFEVHGKTGTGFKRSADGSINRDFQEGWFVGWAEGQGKKIVFAKFTADDKKQTDYAGPRARDAFLQELPGIMTRNRQNEH